jgi:co-chaperonin GroES (HSP10)
MKIRPLNDMVLVKLDPPPTKSGDILLVSPENAPTRTGVVLKVGPGRRKIKKAGEDKTIYIPTQVKPGDHVVFFAAAAGTKKYRLPTYALSDDEALLHEDDILMVFEGDVKVEV